MLVFLLLLLTVVITPNYARAIAELSPAAANISSSTDQSELSLLRKRQTFGDSETVANARDFWRKVTATKKPSKANPDPTRPAGGSEKLKELKTWNSQTQDFSGPTYEKIANTFLENPNFRIDMPSDPAMPNLPASYLNSEIPERISSQYAEREHLVEPQTVVGILIDVRLTIEKSDKWNKARETALMEELASTWGAIMVDYEGNEVEMEGDFWDIVGHGLNSKANLERLLKPANSLKAQYTTTGTDYEKWSETYGNVPVADLLERYLYTHGQQIKNSAAAIHNQLRELVTYVKMEGLLKNEVKGIDFSEALEAKVEDFYNFYDADHPNSLYQRVRDSKAVWQRMGRTTMPQTSSGKGENKVSNLAYALAKLFINGAVEASVGADGFVSLQAFDKETDSNAKRAKPSASSPQGLVENVNGLTQLVQTTCAPKTTRRRIRRGISAVAHLFRRVTLASGVSCSANGEQFVNDNNEEVDNFGNVLDDWGNPCNSEGDYVNENNVATDLYGGVLDDFDNPIDENGYFIGDDGFLYEADELNRVPNLKCKSTSSFSSCRNKLNKQREKQTPKDKEEMREWETKMAEAYGEGNGDVDAAVKDILSRIKEYTKDEKILPSGPDAYDPTNVESIYADAETFDDAWDEISESFETALSDDSDRKSSRPQRHTTIQSWKKYVRALTSSQTSLPRENRDGLKVSEVERRAAEFNHALVTVNAFEPWSTVKEVYNGLEVNMEEFPDSLGDAIRNPEEVSDRSQLAALREFGDALGDGSILPEGTDGLAAKVDDEGNFVDELAIDEGILDVAEGETAPTTWDDVWTEVAEKVSKYIDTHKPDLKLSQYKALLRGLKALKKAINFKTGPGTATLQKALDKIVDKVKEVDRTTLDKDIVEDTAATADTNNLVQSLNIPTIKAASITNENEPLRSPSILNLAEDISGSLSPVSEHVFEIQTVSKFLGESVESKFIRAFKPLARGIMRNLRIQNRPGRERLQSAALGFKVLIDKASEKVLNAREEDRFKMAALVTLIQDTTVLHNDIAAENILWQGEDGSSNIGQIVDLGEVRTFVPEDVPEVVAEVAEALRAKTELKALEKLRKVDKSILPHGGYDPDITNGGQAEPLRGIAEYVRELQPGEIVEGLPEGAGGLEAWNAVAERTISSIDGAEGYAENGPKAMKRNSIRRFLIRAQKSILLRDTTQKVTGPWARDTDKAILRDGQRENHGDISRKLLGVLRSTWDTTLRSFGSTSGTKQSSVDDRDADDVLSVDIVDALGNIKAAGEGIPEADDLLPDEEPVTDPPESKRLTPSSLARHQQTLDMVMQSAVDLSQRVAGDVGADISLEHRQQKKVNLMKGYSKLLKIAKDAKKNFALGIGRLDRAGQSSALDTARLFSTTGQTMGDSFHANNVAEGVGLAENDIPAIRAGDASTASFDSLSGAVNRSPKGLSKWSRAIKKVLNKAKKTATGKALKSSSGNMRGEGMGLGMGMGTGFGP
ncbi:hypothetical protein HK097_004618 [Rhizophlyctis rosea]|uniref:Uncharacterized protein n=1 Tax=Rhizophlyctis rosea TaxID=64517 RepID=A0AAD5SFD2_9FUNG|nr:hypothetical protein HK097_004618 [Rhizophlyctis rosea]